MSDKEPKIHDAEIDFQQDEANNSLIIHRHQHIPDDWRMMNRKIREDSKSKREGEFMAVASIPVEVAFDLKENYGYDVWQEPARKTLAYLRAAGLDDFILTNKQI
jgi:hypothetical protein